MEIDYPTMTIDGADYETATAACRALVELARERRQPTTSDISDSTADNMSVVINDADVLARADGRHRFEVRELLEELADLCIPARITLELRAATKPYFGPFLFDQAPIRIVIDRTR